MRERRERPPPRAQAHPCSACLREAVALCDLANAGALLVGSGRWRVAAGALKYAARAIDSPMSRRRKLFCGDGSIGQDRRTQPTHVSHLWPPVGLSVLRRCFGTLPSTSIHEHGCPMRGPGAAPRWVNVKLGARTRAISAARPLMGTFGQPTQEEWVIDAAVRNRAGMGTARLAASDPMVASD